MATAAAAATTVAGTDAVATKTPPTPTNIPLITNTSGRAAHRPLGRLSPFSLSLALLIFVVPFVGLLGGLLVHPHPHW